MFTVQWLSRRHIQNMVAPIESRGACLGLPAPYRKDGIVRQAAEGGSWTMLTTVDLQVLERLSFADSTLSGCATGLAKIMLFNYWLTLVVLRAKRPRYQPMHHPEGAAAGSNGAQ